MSYSSRRFLSSSRSTITSLCVGGDKSSGKRKLVNFGSASVVGNLTFFLVEVFRLAREGL
jgi:hypothetical protein